MFLFESMPWYAAAMGITVLLGLIFINEITRRSKHLAILTYFIIPIVCTFFYGLKHLDLEHLWAIGFLG